MGCRCNEKRANAADGPGPGLGRSARDPDPVVAAATGRYEVRGPDGRSLGRVYSSLVAAQHAAKRAGGTVVAV